MVVILNQQQSEFIERALQHLTRVMEQCAENSATASAILGRRKVGRYIVVVRIIAEEDEGFSAPLLSHASSAHSNAAPVGSHTNKTNVSGPTGELTNSAIINSSGNPTGIPPGNNPGRSTATVPSYSMHTKHHNRSNRVNRWHKPVFD